MTRFWRSAVFALGLAAVVVAAESQQNSGVLPAEFTPLAIRSDPGIRYDYDIVYVRAPRRGDQQQMAWADVFNPLQAEPGSDLVLLHPDGREEALVAAGDDAIVDPAISFDAQWVYFSRIRSTHSADIFKIHVASRRVAQLTHQEFTPNTGVAAASSAAPGVYNTGPCPLPGGRLMFTSTRNGFVATKTYKALAARPGYTSPLTLQLFTMDGDGRNVEQVGHFNNNGALHPTILKDGRVMFSSFESQGLRDQRMWAIWTIHPDGTYWAPLFSSLGTLGETARHFMTQLSDERVVAEEYYLQQNMGFGTFFTMAPNAAEGQAYFGSAATGDPRNITVGNTMVAFSPRGIAPLTPFSHASNIPATPSLRNDQNSARMGKVTHPSAAPDNDLLTVWSAGPVYGFSDPPGRSFRMPAIDSGIYLIKDGVPVEQPGQMRLIKNDPRYNEQWPRALVPYKRIYAVDEPARLAPQGYGAAQSSLLPEGSPFGLIGSASLYKRESMPLGRVAPGAVTSTYPGGDDPFEGLGRLANLFRGGNWFTQGADSAKYDNSEIHAIRIVATEPTTDPGITGLPSRLWWNAANERLRILGEIPIRKFAGGVQPVDPDGNPDTSFLIKLPADIAWTFQMLDKRGMVLTSSQTWHQVRPGEVRTDCGGCHSHSQATTDFAKTAAGRPDYPVFDLTQQTPLITAKANDASGRTWDAGGETGVRYVSGVKDVEYFRDVKPILDRSCTACHTREWPAPAGNLVLDDDQLMQPADSIMSLFIGNPPQKVPGTFMRLALDSHGVHGYKSGIGNAQDPNQWPYPQASRYIRYFQARRSLLVWKIFGERLDGFRNEDFAYETVPGDRASTVFKGQPIEIADRANNRLFNLAYTGSVMPPLEAVAGNYVGPAGVKIKVPPLSDEDRRTIVRWIDLGCPIDFAFDPARPAGRGRGWLQDDDRPTLTLTTPAKGASGPLTRLLVGMHDYDSGIDLASFRVVADFAINGVLPGQNLAPRFKLKTPGVYELVLARPAAGGSNRTLTVSVKDKAGNVTTIERQW